MRRSRTADNSDNAQTDRYSGLSVHFCVFGRGALVVFPEGFCKIACAVKAHFITDLGDRHVCVKEQLQRLAQTVLRQIGDRRPGEIFPEQGRTAAFADITGIRNLVKRQRFFVMSTDKSDHLLYG